MRSWLSVLIADAMSKKRDDIPIAPSLYSLSNKMDNSLLAVRDINHKYIVVERGKTMQILKLKDGVDVESLRKYGFKTGKEWAAQGERCFLPEVGMSYQYEWFHVFAMDEEEPEKIAYTSDEFSIPRMQLYVRDRHVCCSCSVEGTYHIDNDDMEPLFTVLFDMITDGILEKAEV